MTARRQFLGTAAAAIAAACATPYASAFFSLGSAPAAAPEFTGIETWINSAPLRMADLRGKVVLIDFWT